jgi:hypothetical protein
LYALALNETGAAQRQDLCQALKSGAILAKVAEKLPEHPGVLHYTIQSYEYAPLAKRGIAAANKYAKVAPAAPHAQHMPAHIYSIVGMWTEPVASNATSLIARMRPAFTMGRLLRTTTLRRAARNGREHAAPPTWAAEFQACAR